MIKICKYCSKQFEAKTCTKTCSEICKYKCRKAYLKTWAIDNDNYHSNYRKQNKEHRKKLIKEWETKNPNRYKEYYKLNKEKVKNRNEKWRKNNQYKVNAKEAKRRAQKLNATLPGYDKEIENIYKKCPKGYHVDHIIPLQGKTVCGLHVPWNLQIITAEENLSKGNKIINFV